MNLEAREYFIKDKILQLQTAILYCHSNSVLKLPAGIVSTHDVDSIGCIWILVNRPVQYVNELDKSFHVTLNYYRKGLNFFMDIDGIARVVTDPEETGQLPPALQLQQKNGKMILCVRIKRANYHEKKLPALTAKILHAFSASRASGHYNLSFENNKYVA